LALEERYAKYNVRYAFISYAAPLELIFKIAIHVLLVCRAYGAMFRYNK